MEKTKPTTFEKRAIDDYNRIKYAKQVHYQKWGVSTEDLVGMCLPSISVGVSFIAEKLFK